MKKITASFYSVLALALSAPALAAVPGESEIKSGIDLSKGSIARILENLLNWFAGIIAIVAVAMILWAAFLYMTSAGDDEKIGKAKKTLIFGIAGVIVSLIAFGIFAAVKSFLQ